MLLAIFCRTVWVVRRTSAGDGRRGGLVSMSSCRGVCESGSTSIAVSVMDGAEARVDSCIGSKLSLDLSTDISGAKSDNILSTSRS